MKEYLLRNMLYVPAYQDKFIEKSLSVLADAFIYDLEDSVPDTYKKEARSILRRYIESGVFKNRVVFVRLNSLGSGMLLEDLDYVLHEHVTGFLPTKINATTDIVYYDKLITGMESKNRIKPGHFKLVPLIETAQAVLNVYGICTASKRVIAVCFGGEDFLNDVEGVHGNPPYALSYPRAEISIAAHAAGVQPIDTPYLAVHDKEGFIQEERLSYEMGFCGVQVLSPRQIPFANSCFTPNDEEVGRSKEIMETYKKSSLCGSGVAMYKGKMIGPPMRKRAEKVLETMELIKHYEEKLS